MSLKYPIVSPNHTIKDSMVIIDQYMIGICFVLNDLTLIGIVTDGDLRRSLINGANLEDNVGTVMNTSFFSLSEDKDNKNFRASLSRKYKAIPVVNKDNHLIRVIDFFQTLHIPVLEPDMCGNELKYLSDCIADNWISSSGKFVSLFENMFSDVHKGLYTLSCSSGTAALHLALLSNNIGEGDEVIVPDITFAATINAVLHCGATPVLCDVEYGYWTLDHVDVEKKITKKTKAIIPVHLYGTCADMDSLIELSIKYNLILIEDAAEALGSFYNAKRTGTIGNTGVFSFFGNKTLTTGEGGMLCTKSLATYKKAKLLRDHGMDPSRKYYHLEVGFNYRLTNLQAAVGVAQIERFDEIISKKIYILNYYNKNLKEIKHIKELPWRRINCINSNWLYTVVLNEYIDRDKVIGLLLDEGIETRPTFVSFSNQNIYSKYGDGMTFRNSNLLSINGISLPSSTSLTENHLKAVVTKFNTILSSL